MQASLTIPPEADLISGDNPAYIGYVSIGESRTVNWTLVFVSAPTGGVFTFDVNVSGYNAFTSDYVEKHGYANVTVDTSPPAISILYPQNITYSTSYVSLVFTVNEITNWIGYSLDGLTNVTITGNITLLSLSEGPHYVIVYASDVASNVGGSSRVHFTIGTDPPNEAVGGADRLIRNVVR